MIKAIISITFLAGEFHFIPGILLSFVSGSFVNWRGMALMALLGLLPLMTSLALVPESPIYLIRKGKCSLK